MTRYIRAFRVHFVTAMTAPTAYGWSNIAGWVSHPLENAAFARRTPTPALPERCANGENAATSDVHVLQSVLTLSDNFCPSHRTSEWQVHPEARRTGIACDLNHASFTETIENLRKW
jgi:hypothetical protein